MSLFLAKAQCLGGYINSCDFAIARITLQPGQIAARAGAVIKNLSIYPWRTNRIEQRGSDLAHSHKPPEVAFQFV